MLVAVIGVAVPFVAGAGAGVGLGWDTETAIFLGAALTATSVGITARVFGDLRALATTEARIVLGAAVADDVLGLIILTVVVKVVTGDSVTVGLVASTVLVALAFLVGAGVVGILAVPRLLHVIDRFSRSGTTLTVAALVLVLGLAVLADAAQLAFIIGAFMAGLALGRSEHHERIAGDLNSVGGVLIPVFFVLIGVNADLGAMLRPSVLLDAAILFVIAVAGKLVSAYGAGGTRADRLLVGIGMIPRGEVGLIFASIGLAQGVLDDELYGALLLVVLLTTVVTPPLLRWRIGATGRGRGRRRPDASVTAEPASGWVALHDGELVLDGRPPPTRRRRPSPCRRPRWPAAADPATSCCRGSATGATSPVTWTGDDTIALLDVLRRGNPRAVRLLDVTGVLERGVPTVAAAVARRRADPASSIPLARAAVPDRRPPRRAARRRSPVTDADGARRAREAVLAALVLDVARPRRRRPRRPPAARRAGRRRPGDRRAPARRRPACCAPAPPTSTATTAPSCCSWPRSIGSRGDAVVGPPPRRRQHDRRRRRDRLDQLHALVADLLAHPELLGGDADDARRDTPPGRPRRWSPSRRRSNAWRPRPTATCSPTSPTSWPARPASSSRCPPRGTVRVAVSPEGTPDHWIVDVACRDSEGCSPTSPAR